MCDCDAFPIRMESVKTRSALWAIFAANGQPSHLKIAPRHELSVLLGTCAHERMEHLESHSYRNRTNGMLRLSVLPDSYRIRIGMLA